MDKNDDSFNERYDREEDRLLKERANAIVGLILKILIVLGVIVVIADVIGGM
jgi:hypothetical protein